MSIYNLQIMGTYMAYTEYQEIGGLLVTMTTGSLKLKLKLFNDIATSIVIDINARQTRLATS